MRYTGKILCIGVLAAVASCSHPKPDNSVTVIGDAIIATGTIQLKGTTTYTYGTHILVVNSTTKYLLESTSLNLYPFNGKHVKITATNIHYQAGSGPDLYDVSAVIPE